MFTGIIEEVGAVSRRSGHELEIVAETVLDGLKDGDSVAVNGACMTIAAINAESFVVQVSPESFSRTTLGQLRVGDAVNLERAMPASGRFDGHLVQGHVDGVGQVVSIKPQGDFSIWRFGAAAEVARYLVNKGSVAVDGISLTVVEPSNGTFGVAVIPATIENTTLKTKRPGDKVNLEADIIGKYVYSFINSSGAGGSVTMDLLKKHGFA